LTLLRASVALRRGLGDLARGWSAAVDADGTDDQCHRPEAEKEAVERARRGGPGGERVGRLADVHLVRCLGVGGLREQ
jgi:hypothetical protein